MTDLLGAASPSVAVSDVSGEPPSPESPGASSERDPFWCTICDREFGPDVRQVSNGRFRCLDCATIDRAYHYYFYGDKRPLKSTSPRPPRVRNTPAPVLRIVRNAVGGVRRRGEAVPGSKLKESDIPIIRAAVTQGTTLYALAQTYGVNVRSIKGVVRRETWKHVA